jgi:hypothetical protein
MKRTEEQKRIEAFARELGRMFPHADVECDLLDKGGAWVVLHGPSRVVELQWSPDNEKYGVSIADEDADVAFSGHDEYLPTFELAKARVLALLAGADALGKLRAKRA